MRKIRLSSHFLAARSACFAAIALIAFSGIVSAQNFALDPSFTAGVSDAAGRVMVSAVQPDGKILVGGYFDFANYTPMRGLARFNSDGSLDTSFNPGGTGTYGNGSGVEDIVVLNNGKILIAGYFSGYNGMPAADIARLNADGTFDPTFNSGGSGVFGYYLESLAVQPDGKIIAAGVNITSYNGTSNVGIFRMNADGSLDNSFVSPFTEAAIYQIVLRPDGKILVANGRLRLLNSDGSIDAPFDSATGSNASGQNVALQNDGKILIGGGGTGLRRLTSDGALDKGFVPPALELKYIFPLSNGQILVALFAGAGPYYAKTLVRLNEDGSLDPTFAVFTDDNAEHIAMQPDGKILLSGEFGQVAPGNDRIGIARYDAAGTLDQSFNSSLTGYGAITAMDRQADGKIVVGGNFTTANGQHANKLARFNADGTLDSSFQVGLGPLRIGYSFWLNAIKVQADGKVLVGGNFVGFNGTDRRNMVRLNSDGSVDMSFNLTELTFGYDGVKDIVVQPDGKILICGDTMVQSSGGINRILAARLNSDGSLDPTFSLTALSNSVRSNRIVLQPDGKVIVVGRYFVSPTEQRDRARLNSDGTLDSSFFRSNNPWGAELTSATLQIDGKLVLAGYRNLPTSGVRYVGRVNTDGTADSSFSGVTGFNITPKALLLHANGKILVGGPFSSIGGVPYDSLARLTTDGTLDPAFVSRNFTASSGSAPAVNVLMPDGDERLYIGGTFIAYDNVPRNNLLRIFTGGPTWTPTNTPSASPTNTATPTPTASPSFYEFSAANYIVDEGQIATITVTRTGNTSSFEFVGYQASDGTATGGDPCPGGGDYFRTVPEAMAFPPGVTSNTTTVMTCSDNIVETDETVILHMGSSTSSDTAVLTINDGTNRFPNEANISINSGGAADLYPSTIAVFGVPTTIGSVQITLHNVSIDVPDAVSYLLVSPDGQKKFVLMAGAGGSTPEGPVTLNFTDTAGQVVPDNGPLTTGYFEPTSWGTIGTFPSPAPAGPYSEPGSTIGGTGAQTFIGNFGGMNPNGTWSLYVMAAGTGTRGVPIGSIAGGWSIRFINTTAANASISGRVMTANGQGIRNAKIVITGNSLEQPRVVTTGSFGYFTFDGLATGETYVVSVNSKRYTFSTPSRVISLVDNITDADFIADGQAEGR